MRFKFVVAAGLAAVLSGCAKDPESIAPSYVSEVGYRSWSCQQLGEESARVGEALTRASAQQSNARTNDIVGVVLIGLPVSSLSGDNIAPEVARLKGEQETLRKVMITKNCTAPAR